MTDILAIVKVVSNTVHLGTSGLLVAELWALMTPSLSTVRESKQREQRLWLLSAGLVTVTWLKILLAVLARLV